MARGNKKQVGIKTNADTSYEAFSRAKQAADAAFQKQFPVATDGRFPGGSSQNTPKSRKALKEAEAYRDALIAEGYKAAVKATTSSYAEYGKGTVFGTVFTVYRSSEKTQTA